MYSYLKEKVVGASGSFSGAASILGSWQVCHNVCLGIIWTLSLVGIAVAGMPLFFLTTIAIPMWNIALGLFLLTAYLYITKKCISQSLLLFNAGLLTAGIPFPALQPWQPFFWTAGSVLAVLGIITYAKTRWKKQHD